jgi:hypothetical protein
MRISEDRRSAAKTRGGAVRGGGRAGNSHVVGSSVLDDRRITIQ